MDAVNTGSFLNFLATLSLAFAGAPANWIFFPVLRSNPQLTQITVSCPIGPPQEGQLEFTVPDPTVSSDFGDTTFGIMEADFNFSCRRRRTFC